jgi:hypothetical protein
MVEGRDNLGGGVRPNTGPHEGFLELCAGSASGSLTEEEQATLRKHLAVCAECRKAMNEFEVVVDRGIPALAAEVGPDATKESPGEDASFSQRDAEASFFRRLSEEKKRSVESGGEADGWLSPLVVRRSRNFRRNFDRFHFWLPMAAATLLCLSLGILTYRMGKHQGVEVARQQQENTTPVPVVPQEAFADAIRERDAVSARLEEQGKALGELRREMARGSSENARLKTIESEQNRALEATAGEKKQWTVERQTLGEQVAAADAAVEASGSKLRKLERERSENTLRAASLENKVAELSRLVSEQQQSVSQGQDLLAKDRDIRELMGARDLYITEVHDVAKTGETEKAFGRVFYTKGKSLIFYAYDLSDLPELKEGSSFQAWGRRGPDWAQAFNLGMFYEDNISKKRWVLKFNDKKALDQIDAVFVTLEPHGGSERPTGKPLLFAYLKVKANHP